MIVLLLLVSCASAKAQLSCPASSHYEECGTACPLTCANYADPPRFCTLQCVPGCYCDTGRIRAANGLCLVPEECPPNNDTIRPTACNENEEYQRCGNPCPPTCLNYRRQSACPQAENCVSGCFCINGFVRDPNGRCVRPFDCSSANRGLCVGGADIGYCLGFFPSWYYSEIARDCRQFFYGGCGGNGNRHSSQRECRQRCAGRSPACQLSPDPGPCRIYLRRWHFDSSSGTCKQFIYGGCAGNANNFNSRELCQNACRYAQ